MAFAHRKRVLGFQRLRLRRSRGEHDEFLLATTGQNLPKLTRYTQTLKQTDYAPCLNTETEKTRRYAN